MNRVFFEKSEYSDTLYRYIETDSYIVCPNIYGAISICKKPGDMNNYKDWTAPMYFDQFGFDTKIVNTLKYHLSSDNPDFPFIEKFCGRILRLKTFL